MAERLLASRVADGRGRGHHGPLTFDHLAAWYLDDYLVRRLRTVDTARGRVANLRATFGGQPATVMTVLPPSTVATPPLSRSNQTA